MNEREWGVLGVHMNVTLCMVFDAVQLHATNEGSKDKNKKMWNSKMGLLMMFYKELDKDLLEEWRKEQLKI